jgi:alkylation response protein AidB-like acyl-CoA dehydrogenase
VGEPGQGWSYAKFLLDNERTTSSFIYFNKRELRRTQAIARAEMLDGKPLVELPQFQSRIARLEAEVNALEWSVLRTLADEKFAYDDTAVASILKVSGSKLQQAITELQVELLGARDALLSHRAARPRAGRTALARPRTRPHRVGTGPARLHHLWRHAASAEKHHCQAGFRALRNAWTSISPTCSE